jgi:hypothetical protein
MKFDGNYATCSIPLGGFRNSILENLEVTRGGSQGIYGIGNTHLLNLHVHHNGGVACGDEPPHHQHGLYTGTSADEKDNVIDGGSYHHNTGYGIQCYSTCSGTTIRNIKVYNNNSWGVFVCCSGSGNKVYNVVAYQNDLTRDNGGICLCSPNVEGYNLTVYDNEGIGILVGGSGIIVRNSISLGNSGPNYQVSSGSPTTSNNIFSGTASDHFVDVSTYDLQLQLASTARDAGTSISGTFMTDLRGSTRPQGVAWDVGAYEFIAAQTPAAPSGLTISVFQ